MLDIVLVFVEDLRVCLSNVLTKHGYRFISRLMVECQQVDSELVVDVLCDGFTLIVLFCRLNSILLVLDPAGHA